MNIQQVITIGLALFAVADGGNASEEVADERLIMVSIAGEKLGNVLHQLHLQYGYNFVVHPDIRVEASGPQIYVAQVPAPHALRVVAAAYGACANVGDTLVSLRPCDDGDYSGRASAVRPPTGHPGVFLGVVVEKNGSRESGVAVTEVDSKGPAHRVGIRGGVVILSYNRELVSEGEQLQSLVRSTQPGDRVAIEVLRGSERISFNVQF